MEKMKKILASSMLVAVALTFAACSSKEKSDDNSGGASSKPYTMSFSELALPTDNNGKAAIRSATSVTVNGTAHTIGFSELVKTGQTVNGVVFGTIKDKDGANMTYADGSAYVCHNGSGPDHTTILENGGNLYMVSQMECDNGGVYVTKLSQNASTGALALDSTFAPKWADFSADGGTYIGCAGQKTSWGTHLGSEEYEPDMGLFDDAADTTNNSAYDDPKLVAIAEYQKLAGTAWTDADSDGKVDSGESRDAAKFQNIGYWMGFITEVSVDASGNPTAKKHYSMGRFAHELGYVMPDNKTVYLTDDGQNTGLFMYVATTAGDLSAGTLYAAKWTQTSATGVGSANLTWYKLGTATDAEIKALVTSGTKFRDIFTRGTLSSSGSTAYCDSGFTLTKTYYNTMECLKVNSGMEKAAAFLETRRYAAMLGATTEFNKEEGVTFNSDDNKLYVAMSVVKNGMKDESASLPASLNHIALTENLCGAVYELPVTSGVSDTASAAINSSYVATTMSGLVAGTKITTDSDGNKCALTGISEPDNVAYLPGYGVLLIGEDTGSHVNDMVWAMDIKGGTNLLTRIFTAPAGSETTSPFWDPNIGGYGYLMMVIQHPFGESDLSGYTPTTTADNNDVDEKSSVIGYIGPFPALN